MSPYSLVFFLLFLPLLPFLKGLIISLLPYKSSRRLPPGPRGLPIIGSLNLLGKLPHRSLNDLAKKYGPIMSMKLGNVTTIVVSSPQIAEKILKTHDLVFASRPQNEAGKHVSYGNRGIAFGEYGHYWRNIRKLCTLELFSAKKIDSFSKMRREELVMMVNTIKEAAKAGKIVDVSDLVGDGIEKMTYRMLFGKTSDVRFDLKGTMLDIMDQAGAFNIADYVPMLGPLDIQGLTRKIKDMRKTMDKILDTFISEHEEAASTTRPEGYEPDFVDILLSVSDKSEEKGGDLTTLIDRDSIKAILVDMIAAGIDTSRTTIEWIMAELIKNPRILKKLQQEIKDVVGDADIVEEKDLRMNLGLVKVRQIVAQLVHSFDYELPNGMSASDLDMDEKFGLALPRENHLLVLPSVRI
ncbi:putative flavonoid 3',5'-hydroxylase [Heracleum sosnowskyi]|uniref:Flavonoid 3',5'-hydroxylase n=1 Tax=Heracleum sosnowskyi TaxID=360622 RepID=A0AAD8HRH9_9APIA|nr:putative flavonoid 3',5'-hydroxylase [Heracleum sosnowskyi]